MSSNPFVVNILFQSPLRVESTFPPTFTSCFIPPTGTVLSTQHLQYVNSLRYFHQFLMSVYYKANFIPLSSGSRMHSDHPCIWTCNRSRNVCKALSSPTSLIVHQSDPLSSFTVAEDGQTLSVSVLGAVSTSTSSSSSGSSNSTGTIVGAVIGSVLGALVIVVVSSYEFSTQQILSSYLLNRVSSGYANSVDRVSLQGIG